MAALSAVWPAGPNEPPACAELNSAMGAAAAAGVATSILTATEMATSCTYNQEVPHVNQLCSCLSATESLKCALCLILPSTLPSP